MQLVIIPLVSLVLLIRYIPTQPLELPLTAIIASNMILIAMPYPKPPLPGHHSPGIQLARPLQHPRHPFERAGIMTQFILYIVLADLRIATDPLRLQMLHHLPLRRDLRDHFPRHFDEPRRLRRRVQRDPRAFGQVAPDVRTHVCGTFGGILQHNRAAHGVAQQEQGDAEVLRDGDLCADDLRHIVQDGLGGAGEALFCGLSYAAAPAALVEAVGLDAVGSGEGGEEGVV